MFDLRETEKIDPDIFGRVCRVDFPEPVLPGSVSPTESSPIISPSTGWTCRNARFYHFQSLYDRVCELNSDIDLLAAVIGGD